MATTLVRVPALATWIKAEHPLVILDARARLNDPAAGYELWRESHIPGARHADMDRDLAAAPSTEGGRHPLPDKAAFTARLNAWGITPKHRVVVYDDTGGQIAGARAWWMLKWAGHPSVHFLNGGWQAWQNAGQPTESAEPQVAPSNWEPEFDDGLIAPVDEVANGTADLLDARGAERYRGEHEPIDPVAGHIPGARNIPGASLLDANQAFLPPDGLQEKLPDSGNAIAYCGSGISACQLILAYSGLERPLPRLYPGSWSAWSRDPERPVATGEE